VNPAASGVLDVAVERSAVKNGKRMIARIRTILPCTESELWQKISQPRSLQYVASPILVFVPARGDELTSEWQIGRVYRLKLYFLKLIPLGWHTIRLVKMDKKANTISSRESGLLAQVWNHNISFREVGPGKVSYTDEIEIQAGCLTPAIWLFAHLFYRHRQGRWKVLLKEISCATNVGRGLNMPK